MKYPGAIISGRKTQKYDNKTKIKKITPKLVKA